MNRYIFAPMVWAVVWALTARPTAAAPPDVDAKGLPAGWQAAPIGTDDTLTDKQSVSVENGVWTLQAGGQGLGGEVDGGLFVYQALRGGSIRARLIRQNDPEDDGSTQTGVALREGTEPGARVLRLSYTSGNLLVPSVRVSEEGMAQPVGEPGSDSIGLVGRGTAVSPPAGRPLGDGIWIGIERDGSTVRFYWSEDGNVWNEVGRATTAIAEEALIGIEASKHGGSALQTSRLDNLTVSAELIRPRALTEVAYLPRDGSVLVTWRPVAIAGAEVSYNVYRVTANGGQREKLNAEPIKTSSFLVEGLTNGQRYWFGVTAVINGVESGLQMPEPNSNNQNGQRRVGVAIPGPALLGGLQLYHIGLHEPASIQVTGEGAAAKITFRAAGTNVWQTGDGIPFLAIPIEGDLDISARFVKGPTEADGGGWEHGGVMIRESLDPGARFVYAEVPLDNRLEFKRRRAPAQQNIVSFVHRDDNAARPVAVRLTRRGDTFECFYSEDDGRTWLPLGDPDSAALDETSKDTIAGFPKRAFVGLTLCPHFTGVAGRYTEAEIDQFEIKTP